MRGDVSFRSFFIKDIIIHIFKNTTRIMYYFDNFFFIIPYTIKMSTIIKILPI